MLTMEEREVFEIKRESGAEIREKLAAKKSSLQFLPAKLAHLSSKKTFDHAGKTLKSAYAIDLAHSLILKYYFKKENKFSLMSTILKEKYGSKYNHYVDYLVSIRVIEMVANYFAGRNARVYKICPDVLKGTITRYDNRDTSLLKKYRNKISRVEEVGIGDSPILPEVKAKLVDDLFHIGVDLAAAIFYLDNLKDAGGDIYNKNRYSVECIDDRHIFYHFDEYGRMHTNFTILKSFIRKACLRIGGEPTHEIDIKNSQPLFLAKMIQDSGSRWVKEEELELFKYLTFNGLFYQYAIDAGGLMDRKAAKDMTYKVLFGKNASNSKADKTFSALFPTIHNYIKLYKKEKGDYKAMAYELQRAESDLIFNKIVKRIMENLPDARMVTVHDSIIVQHGMKDEIESIFNLILHEEMKMF